MTAWILSTEPGSFPWTRVEAEKRVLWDEIRGPLARKYLGQATAGDAVWGYHTSPEKALVCLARVAGPAVPDPADPRWLALPVVFERWLPRRVPLAVLREEKGLGSLPFLRIPRLSVSPVTGSEHQILMGLSGTALKGG